MSAHQDISFGTDGWRAVIADDFTFENVRRVADAAARTFIQDHGRGKILVGYDTRFGGEVFASVAAEVMAGHDLDVVVSDRCMPTPALCWSVAHDPEAIGGLVVTASHNPAQYSGIKIRMRDGGASPVVFTDRVESALALSSELSRGPVRTADLMSPYLAALLGRVDTDLIRGAALRVVVDSLYGAGQHYLADTLRDAGVDVNEIHAERNPGFAGLHPEPIPPHIDGMREAVVVGQRDAGFATDGDADRIGAADATGAFVNPHRLICLIARHLAENRGETGRIVKTLSTSVLVDRLGYRLGLPVTTTPVGFKWIYEEMLRGDVLIGGEESGGIGVPTHVRERDGLLMALLLVEMMAHHGKGLGELVASLFELTGPMEYQRVDLALDPSVMASFRDRVMAAAPEEVAGLEVKAVLRTDGLKLLLPDDAWLLLRPSGTEPLVRVYAEASSAGVVDDLLAAGKAIATGEGA